MPVREISIYGEVSSGGGMAPMRRLASRPWRMSKSTFNPNTHPRSLVTNRDIWVHDSHGIRSRLARFSRGAHLFCLLLSGDAKSGPILPLQIGPTELYVFDFPDQGRVGTSDTQHCTYMYVLISHDCGCCLTNY